MQREVCLPPSLGGLTLTFAPCAITNGLHRVDVLYAGSDGKPYVSWWEGGAWWSKPEKIGDETLKLMPRPSGIPAGIPWKMRWSPTQIAGWLVNTYPEDATMRASHETIYRSLFVHAAS